MRSQPITVTLNYVTVDITVPQCSLTHVWRPCDVNIAFIFKLEGHPRNAKCHKQITNKAVIVYTG